MKRRMNAVIAILVCALAVSMFASIYTIAGTGSNAQPANKVVASASTIEIFNKTSGVETLLTSYMKTSTPEDLVIQLNAETALYTKISAKGGAGSTAVVTSQANAGVVVWVEVDGVAVAVTNIPANMPNSTDDGKVTLDNREFGITYSLPSLNTTDFMELWIQTKSTHGFNWVTLNVGAGTHTIVVKAQLTASSTSDAMAWAAIGKRTVVIEPTKLANNAQI